MHEITPLLRFLGMRPTGDLGPLTIYTNKRGRMVAFPKAPPEKPASLFQTAQRNRFRAAGTLWRTLTEDQKHEWQAAADIAGLYCTGYNLFLYYVLTRDDSTIRTIEHQTGRTLLPIP